MIHSSTRLVMWTSFVLCLWIFLSPTEAMSEPSGNETYDMMMAPSMEHDMSYCQMLMEGPQPPSMEGIPWYCICSYCKGTVGPKGDQGSRGFPGIPGSPGPRGITGFRGWKGFRGPPGLKGQKGDEGEKGGMGPLGYTGPKGARGYKGDKGDQGLEGPPGEQGPQGEPGQCREPCVPISGPPGPPGLPGFTGPRGLPGVKGTKGEKGLKGDTGEIGPVGPAGTDGQKGEQGAEGECNCQDGADGTNGRDGLPGPKGDKGDAGPQGEKGDLGEKGNMGLPGMMGMPGPCSAAIQSAFSAALATSFPAPNFPVPFTRILYNMQGHFDPAGIYMAPVNGTYIFSYHLIAYRRVLKVRMFCNFEPVVTTTETTNLGTASQQVVLHLYRGDTVWLQVRDIYSNGMFASSESSSTFSGFLLHPDTCDMPMFRLFPPEPMKGEYTWGEMEGPPTPSPTPSPN